MKTPFYMTYPMQNLYQAEMEYEKDMERMKELYPREVKKILLCVEDRCDELEFEGSRIYDENPDRLMMEREILALYEKLLREGMSDRPDGGIPEKDTASESNEVHAQECGRNFALYPPEGWAVPEEKQLAGTSYSMQSREHRESEDSCTGWLCNMVGVLFQDEVYRRRCRYRRCHRWW